MKRKIKYWRWRWRNRHAEKCDCGIPIAAPWSWCGMEPCKVMDVPLGAADDRA